MFDPIITGLGYDPKGDLRRDAVRDVSSPDEKAKRTRDQLTLAGGGFGEVGSSYREISEAIATSGAGGTGGKKGEEYQKEARDILLRILGVMEGPKPPPLREGN